MKIAVIGTSNSILANGYFPLYQALEYPNTVDNLSLGGANCQLIPFSLEKHKIIGNYDFLITDCAVNDADYLVPCLRSGDWLYNELYTIMSAVREANIRHLHLIFPLDNPDKTAQQIHRQVCEELSVPYIDVLSLLTALPRKEERGLYSDSHHVNFFYAKQLAYLIKKEREKICADKTPKDRSACKQSKKYFYLPLTETFGKTFPTVTKNTSLVCDDYLVLKNGETLKADNLPSCELESVYFWSNSKAGCYHLASENARQNYNLFIFESHFSFFRPLARKPFPVNGFLTLNMGQDPNCPAPLSEFNAAPLFSENNELLLNAFLFSQQTAPPLQRTEKQYSGVNREQLDAFAKINSFAEKIKHFEGSSVFAPQDFIFIAANIYPKNAALRKQYAKLAKKTDNLYFLYYYVRLYLLPRKKYTAAARLLEKITEKNFIPNVLADLVTCCLELGRFEQAYGLIKSLDTPKYRIIQLRLYCSLYAHMRQDVLFFRYAQKMLELNEGYSTTLHLINCCILMEKYQEASVYLKKTLEDPRCLNYENVKKTIMKKTEEVNSYLK